MKYLTTLISFHYFLITVSICKICSDNLIILFCTADNELLGIREAMDDMESKTCIRFIERTDQIDYIDIQSGHGCWSKVGKRGGRQFVTLMSLSNLQKK